MLSSFDEKNFGVLCAELASRDEDIAAIARVHGNPPRWHRPNTFESLVHIILEQQVSLASALAALNKLREKVGEVTPEHVLRLTDEEFRACYFSRQKAGYVRFLAEALASGRMDLGKLAILPDEEVRARLVTLKGIGNWTVDIYLIFVLGRTDIFPAGDLAAVNALKRLKKLPPETTRDMITAIAARWQPYRTIATMFLWHYYLSEPRKKQPDPPVL